MKSKNLSACLLCVDFSKAFDTIHRGKPFEILLAYGLPQETVNAISMHYQDSRAMVRSPDGDTDFFQIISGVLQGDTLAPYLFIICLDYALRISADKHKELGFTLEHRSSRHPAKYMTDIDFADDIALLADNIADAEKLLHHIEAAAREVGLYINAKKTEFMSQTEIGILKSLDYQVIKQASTEQTHLYLEIKPS